MNLEPVNSLFERFSIPIPISSYCMSYLSHFKQKYSSANITYILDYIIHDVKAYYKLDIISDRDNIE